MGILVLGSGPAGIAAGSALKERGLSPVLFEKNQDWGGLCGNFSREGFRFDKFTHFAHSLSPEMQARFHRSSPLRSHPPDASNYYKGIWLRNPAQHHLFPLSCEEKVAIIADYVRRPVLEHPRTYAEWLLSHYGETFARSFVFAYTRKYWRKEPQELETRWIGPRMAGISLEEMLQGAFEEQDRNFYYAAHMYYPIKNGFRSILDLARKGLTIQFEKKALRISLHKKKVFFEDGTHEAYETLFSSLPLPEIASMIDECPEEVRQAAAHLQYTRGFMVSLGFKEPDIAKHLWFYVYDEEIPATRVYAPNLKAQDNVPKGCSALQAEVFVSNREKIPDKEKILEHTLSGLSKMGLFRLTEVVFADVRFEAYANVIFDHEIYRNRSIVLSYLEEVGILPIGRFGKWDFFWTHQAFLDGENAAIVFCQEKAIKD
ncbi:MAG: FAD-dependent oxidoreductase [Holosporales bacterium]|jgi:protoporphyrinogen oxidase|nr:FAD-dependent oxidoreductase [Holosporales bacterium]